MVKTAYIRRSLRGQNRDLLDRIVEIAERYGEMGHRITVRQLYYQLVSRNILPNTMSSYRNTSKLLAVGRMTGRVDWDVIEDRARRPVMAGEFGTMADFIRAVRDSYRRRRWETQGSYLEVLVEKESLAGILEPVTRKYHVLLLANKGYSSVSATYEVAQRIAYHGGLGKSCHILYLGDHDPSGIDMARDIEDRLRRFGAAAEVERIALTMDQIREHGLPPNPAKTADPRSGGYLGKYGGRSWELDALDPRVLAGILESGITRHMDVGLYEAVIRTEEREKAELDRLAGRMRRF